MGLAMSDVRWVAWGRHLLAACIAALSLGAMAQPMVIAVSRTSLALPFYVAEAQNHFAAEGVAVKVQECIGGQRCLKQLFDGQVVLATASEMPVTLHSFTRADFAIVATFVSSSRDVKLIARKSAGISVVADLAAKRIGTVKGTSAHYFLDAFLLFHGIDPKKIELVALSPEQIEPALKAGQIDAATVWEPFAHKSMRALAGDGAVLPAARIYTETFNLIGSRKAITEREADVVKVLRALGRAQRFIREQPLQAQAILKARLQEDQGFIDATWRDFDYRLSLDQSLLSTLEGQARWALREGHVPAGSISANFLQFVDTGPLRKADPAAVTLVK